jgi:argininosuccinate lyase
MAHAIAGRLLEAHRERPDAPLGATLATVSGDLLGVALHYSDAQLAQIMSARHFVEVRQTHGGPAPVETARAVAASKHTLQADRAWHASRRDAIAAADATLRARSLAL